MGDKGTTSEEGLRRRKDAEMVHKTRDYLQRKMGERKEKPRQQLSALKSEKVP
jgi:hypothetical protein